MTEKAQVKRKRWLYHLLSTFAGLAVAYIIITLFCPVFVDGESMWPTLNSGDILLASSDMSYESIDIGDIVVFKDKMQLIKRVVGKENDILVITNGVLYINGEASPYQYESIYDPGILETEFVVPVGQLFCLGDNRNNSMDCRQLGPVSMDTVKSKVLKRVFNAKTRELTLKNNDL